MIVIEYIVKDRNGGERLRTTDKKAADAYDRALENADRLAQMLRDDRVLPHLTDADLEELTIYLSRNARNVERVLKGKEPEPSTPDADSGPEPEAAGKPTDTGASEVPALKAAS